MKSTGLESGTIAVVGARQNLDQTLLKTLAQRYSGVLSKYFRRRGCDIDDVDDLVQSVFVRLAGRRSDDAIDNPEAYLITTASSVWNDYLRSRQRRHHADHAEYEDEKHSTVCFGPDRVLEGKEAVMQLVAALGELPDRTRQIYVLCRIDGMKRKDVAVRLGISVSALEKHLARATLHVGEVFGDLY